MEITCYIVDVKGKSKKQKAILIFQGKFNLFVNCNFRARL